MKYDINQKLPNAISASVMEASRQDFENDIVFNLLACNHLSIGGTKVPVRNIGMYTRFFHICKNQASYRYWQLSPSTQELKLLYRRSNFNQLNNALVRKPHHGFLRDIRNNYAGYIESS